MSYLVLFDLGTVVLDVVLTYFGPITIISIGMHALTRTRRYPPHFVQ